MAQHSAVIGRTAASQEVQRADALVLSAATPPQPPSSTAPTLHSPPSTPNHPPGRHDTDRTRMDLLSSEVVALKAQLRAAKKDNLKEVAAMRARLDGARQRSAEDQVELLR